MKASFPHQHLVAQGGGTLNEDVLKGFKYRALGPARQGGRILRIVVPESQPFTFYVVTATGGLWKTENNGTTFTPIFENESTMAIGDMAVAASDPDVLTATAVDAFSTDSGATEATYEISVAQLARGQENSGLELNTAGASVVDMGTNTFNVNIDGQDYELSIEVTEGDTNEDVLQKMAQSINDASIGTRAEVSGGREE